MSRYSKELSAELLKLNSSHSLENFQYKSTERLNRLAGPVWSSRIGRWLIYPALAGQIKADIFHVLDQSHANLCWTLEPARTVVTCHDIIPLLALKGKLQMPRRKLSTYPFLLASMKRAAHIIAISESTKQGLIEEANFNPEKITVIHYGLNPCFISIPQTQKHNDADFIREQLKLPKFAKIILHVGTANRYKNNPAIIHALSYLLKEERFANLFLVRLGADFFSDEQLLINQLGIRDRIIYGGRVNSDEILSRYYRGADVFIFPSLWEGFGWPPLEAMSCGTPVITSDVASLPEVVGDAALTVSPEDYAGLAKQIAEVLSNEPLRETMIAKGLLQSRKFRWKENAEQTLAVYERVHQSKLSAK
ncbi:MAG: glycosyltransferase family 4 protein [Candidatus Obscuribacterales bacterium]|nr:glycosyltransferase family 4 protein [Candidatus Obscuribacterales bacterium]